MSDYENIRCSSKDRFVPVQKDAKAVSGKDEREHRNSLICEPRTRNGHGKAVAVSPQTWSSDWPQRIRTARLEASSLFVTCCRFGLQACSQCTFCRGPIL